MSLSHVTRGRVLSVNGSTVVFRPANTNYELHLQGGYSGPLDTPIDAVIRGTARKIYTVPSGGGFLTPIQGPTRIVQGRVADLTTSHLAVKCAAIVNVKLPTIDGAMELARGSISHGALVNVVLMPGATFDVAEVRPADAVVTATTTA